MSAPSASRAGSPYMTRKHTQRMKLVSKAAALIHVTTNFPSPAQRPAGQNAAGRGH